MEWYVENHLVARFANSNTRKMCNAKFKIVDNEIYFVAIKPIKRNEEIFVHYKISSLHSRGSGGFLALRNRRDLRSIKFIKKLAKQSDSAAFSACLSVRETETALRVNY